MSQTITSHFPDVLEVKDYFENDAAKVYLYGQIAVVEATEGATLSYRTGFTLLVKGLKICGTKPWIYISNRVNSYSVVPTDYKYLNKVPTLKGLVIVSPKESEINNARLEEAFFKKPFMIVNTLEEAYQWSKDMLDNTKK